MILTIKKEQLAALGAQLEERANIKLIAYLKDRFPSVFKEIEDKHTLRLIQDVRKRAMSYEIVREDNIATFLDLTIMYGKDFHYDPWAKDVLQLTALHGPDKMALLRHYVRQSGVDL